MPSQSLRFRWKYIVLPLAVLLVSLAIAVIFYGRLPAELAYNFKPGAADKTVNCGIFLIWTLTPQLVMVLMGVAVVAVVARIANRLSQETNLYMTERALMLMGNIFILPQLILSFAMLDVFLYNLYQIHLMPLWTFTLVVMVLGAICLGVFFMQALGQLRVKERK
ncbi:MAG: hypothetical protein PHR43_00460 [Dehalococcoidales bacterium]|nr:hypothetical protein [Dehalococcoidales bacterium]